jgi:cytochrome c-type biogenesis protein CcmH
VAQPIAESDARLSEQMRDRIRTDIAVGLSNENILASLSATYGDSIRLKPKVEPRTAILWAAPWAALILGTLFIGLSRRRETDALSEADHER